jgi:hypothetical protein
MEKTLTAPSKRQCGDGQKTIESLISDWVAKLALNAGAALDAKTQAVYCSIWLEGLSDLSPAVLVAAFRKTLRECPYWPVKVADIRKQVSSAVNRSTDEAAEKAWERVVEIRRVYWNPDIPGEFNHAVSRLSERVKQAARAAGVWRDFTESEWEAGALHTWAKKRFFESFNAWGEYRQDELLLPEGEVKKLLIEFSESKAALPAPKPEPAMPSEERLRVADELAAAAKQVLGIRPPAPRSLRDTPERRAELQRQAEEIKAKYANRQSANERQATR